MPLFRENLANFSTPQWPRALTSILVVTPDKCFLPKPYWVRVLRYCRFNLSSGWCRMSTGFCCHHGVDNIYLERTSFRKPATESLSRQIILGVFELTFAGACGISASCGRTSAIYCSGSPFKFADTSSFFRFLDHDLFLPSQSSIDLCHLQYPNPLSPTYR